MVQGRRGPEGCREVLFCPCRRAWDSQPSGLGLGVGAHCKPRALIPQVQPTDPDLRWGGCGAWPALKCHRETKEGLILSLLLPAASLIGPSPVDIWQDDKAALDVHWWK